MKLSNLSKYAIWRSRTYNEQLLLAKVRVNKDQIIFEFFTDKMKFCGVPQGPCGNPGMSRRLDYHKGAFYSHEDYGRAKILSIEPYDLSRHNPMNETELLAKLVRGENLDKLLQITQEQQSISTNRLYLLLEEALNLQKEWVHRYQCTKDAGKILAFASPELTRSELKVDISKKKNWRIGDEVVNSNFPVKGKVIGVDHTSQTAIVEFIYPKTRRN